MQVLNMLNLKPRSLLPSILKPSCKTMDISSRSKNGVRNLRVTMSHAKTGTDYTELIQESAYLVMFLLKEVAEDQHICDAQMMFEERDYFFFRSWTAYSIYAVTLFSLLLRRPYIMLGCVLIMILQITWVLLRWVFYFLDNDQLWKNIEYWMTWIRLIIRDSETILDGKNVAKHIAGGTVLWSSQTSTSYWRAIYRYKTHQMNVQAAKMTTGDRYVYTEQIERARLRLKEMTDESLDSAGKIALTLRNKVERVAPSSSVENRARRAQRGS